MFVGFHAAHLMSISARLRIWEEEKGGNKVESESKSARKVSVVTFVSLCLIAHVILPLVTLRPACRPAVYSVLVTLPPTLLRVRSLTPLHSLYDLIFSLRPHKLISKHPPLSHLSSVTSVRS